MNTYDIGDKVRLKLVLKDYDGALINGTVTCAVIDPSAAPTAPSVTNGGTGIYYAYVDVDEAGTWRYRFESTGAVVSAGEGSFSVRPSFF